MGGGGEGCPGGGGCQGGGGGGRISGGILLVGLWVALVGGAALELDAGHEDFDRFAAAVGRWELGARAVLGRVRMGMRMRRGMAGAGV